MPVSSHASRLAAPALLSPLWIPPPGNSHHGGLELSAGSQACSSSTRDWGSSRIRRAACRLLTFLLRATGSCPAHGQDGHIVGERRRREVASCTEQGLAEGVG